MIKKDMFFKICKNTAAKTAAMMLAITIAASPCTALASEAASDGQAQEQGQGSEQETGDTVTEQAENTEAGSTMSTAEAASTEEPRDNDRTTSSMAEELKNQRSQIADDDILQIRIGYKFDDGSFDEWARGTAFVVGPRYLLTRQSLINTKTESYLYKKILLEREELYKRIGVALKDEVEAEKHIIFYVEDRNGYVIEYTDTAIKNGMGLVILKDPLDNIPAVVFEDPARIDFATGQLVHIKAAGKMDGRCDVKTLEGSVVENEDPNAAFSFRTDDTEAGIIGAPLYNEEGNVTGMVSGDGDIKTGFDVNAIRTFLSVNGVKFRSAEKIRAELDALEQESGQAEYEETQQEKKADKTALEAAVAGARAVEDLSPYTEESAKAFSAALAEAEEVLSDENALQENVDSATKKLETAQGGLTEKSLVEKLRPYLGIIIGLLALIGVIAVIILKRMGALPLPQKGNAGKKKEMGTAKRAVKKFRRDKDDAAEQNKTKEAPDKKEQADPADAYADDYNTDDDDYDDDPDDEYLDKKPRGEYVNDDGLDITHRGAVRGHRVTADNGPSDLTYLDNSEDPDGKVSVLDDGGSSDTTILGQNAYLIRKDNGKKIIITQEEWEVGSGANKKKKKGFVIGKEQKKVNYCTGQNPTVSRTHCMIRFINGRYYIEDLNSRNFTFINGKQIPAETPILLEDGMMIRLSNVDFEFHET